MNRILAITRNTIPYVKELRALVDSVAGCVLMQQLDYWFDRYPNGFYKFQSPTEHPQYKPEQSWTEELGFSKDEFRTAFDKIGIRYKSKSEYRASEDTFQGKFYCSYHDRIQGLTFYLRNHELVDNALDGLLVKSPAGPAGTPPTEKSGQSEKKEPAIQQQKQSVTLAEQPKFTVNQHVQSTVNGQSRFTVNRQSQLTVNEHPQVTELGKPDLQETGNPDLHITDTTKPETTSELLPLPTMATADQAVEANPRCGGSDDLIFSEKLSQPDVVAIKKIFLQQASLHPTAAQLILDELDGVMRNAKLRGNPVGFVVTLARRNEDGLFVPAYATEIQRARQVAQARKESEVLARQQTGSCVKSEEQLKAGRQKMDVIKNIVKGARVTSITSN